MLEHKSRTLGRYHTHTLLNRTTVAVFIFKENNPQNTSPSVVFRVCDASMVYVNVFSWEFWNTNHECRKDTVPHTYAGNRTIVAVFIFKENNTQKTRSSVVLCVCSVSMSVAYVNVYRGNVGTQITNAEKIPHTYAVKQGYSFSFHIQRKQYPAHKFQSCTLCLRCK